MWSHRNDYPDDLKRQARELYGQVHNFRVTVRLLREETGVTVHVNTIKRWAGHRQPDGEKWPGYLHRLNQ